jgi:signal transduction histidine kinase
MSRFGLRRRLLLVVVLTVAVAVAGLVAGFNLVLGHTLDHDSRDLVRSRAVAQLSSIGFRQGHLTTGESPDEQASDAYIWVFEGSRLLERPRAAGEAVDSAARALASGPTRYRDVPESDARLYSVPVINAGKRVGTVVAGVSLSPYEATRGAALIASLIFGALVLLVVSLAVRWLVGASLRPVVRMTRQAADWSEQDLDHRFALGPPHDELTELAATLDGLLDRVAASLRHERRFSAEISHELRTPLARVLAESELALRRERQPDEYRQALEVIQRSADQLARTVDALVAAARYEAGGDFVFADAKEVAENAAAACAGLAASREVDVEIVPQARALRIGIDPDLAARILQPVVENACRYGSSRVRVNVARENSTVVFAIDDDGPGVADDERERIFEPGVRGAAQGANGNAGAGLGLALARRLARTVHGDVYAEAASAGGRFVIRLPAA